MPCRELMVPYTQANVSTTKVKSNQGVILLLLGLTLVEHRCNTFIIITHWLKTLRATEIFIIVIALALSTCFVSSKLVRI